MTASGRKRLGAILVERGVITAEQLDGALELQIISGGRLGTNLVDLRHLSVEQVGLHLGLQHGLPVASYVELFAVPDSVAALVPKAQATRYKVFPLRVEAKLLHLAMTDPADLVALDELSFLTGMKVAPHVTPELRMLQVLEKRHGFLRERRFLRIPDETDASDLRSAGPGGRISMLLPSVKATVRPSGRGSPAAAALGPTAPAPARPTTGGAAAPRSAPAPAVTPTLGPRARPAPTAAGSNPGAPEAADELIFLDDVAAATVRATGAKAAPAPSEPIKPAVAIREEEDDFDLIIEIDAPDATAAGEEASTGVYGGVELGPAPAVAAPEPSAVSDESTAVHLQNTLSASGILAVAPALERASDRDEVIRLLLRPFGSAPALGALFLVRGDMLVGQQAAATTVSQEIVRRLVLPLHVPSLLQSAHNRRQVVRGTARDDPMQQVIARYLRWEDPAEACVAPIVLKDRVVNLLCVQTTPGTRFEDSFAGALATLCELCAKAYARLVERRRQLTTRELQVATQAPSRATVPVARPEFPHRRVFITGQVGTGRSSTVWRAIDVATQKVVAVKVFPDERLRGERYDALVRAVETLRKLEHPCIGKLHEVGRTSDGSPYVVAEWHGGMSLRTWLAKTPTPRPSEVLAIVGQIAGALTAAHARGIVHGNLRPSNVLFASPDRLGIAVVDFGVPGGAPADGYQAPEHGETALPGAPEDIYSLAVMACEMLPGPTVPEQATFVSRDLPPSLANLAPQARQVILGALSRHPEERPDAMSFARDLQRTLGARR
jgi:hypothetical protein